MTRQPPSRRSKTELVGWIKLRTNCDESGEEVWWETTGGLLQEPPRPNSFDIYAEVRRVVRVAAPKRRRGK